MLAPQSLPNQQQQQTKSSLKISKSTRARGPYIKIRGKTDRGDFEEKTLVLKELMLNKCLEMIFESGLGRIDFFQMGK